MTSHEVSSYTWWLKHEGSTHQRDRCFATKRMALLYICKRNSEVLQQYAESNGKPWRSLFSESHGLLHNGPFDLRSFIALSDDQLKVHADSLASAFYRFKVEQGVLYRYTPQPRTYVTEDELLCILTREQQPEHEATHAHRQRLLLSDIAGFD